MDKNTQANIASNARHAASEIEGILNHLNDPDYVWACLGAAYSRLHYIEELLEQASHQRPKL